MTKPRWYCKIFRHCKLCRNCRLIRGQLYTVGYYFRVGKTIVRITLKKTKPKGNQ